MSEFAVVLLSVVARMPTAYSNGTFSSLYEWNKFGLCVMWMLWMYLENAVKVMACIYEHDGCKQNVIELVETVKRKKDF